jgi:hypothetical protein
MKNTNKLKRTIACGAAGVLTLVFVATATSYDSASFLFSRFLLTQERELSNYSKTSEDSTNSSHPKAYPDSITSTPHEDNYKDPSYSGDNLDYSKDYQSEKIESEWDDGYTDYQNNDKDYPNTATTYDYKELKNRDNYNQNYSDYKNEQWDNYSDDEMHKSAADDDQRREENDDYKEYEKQAEEKEEHDQREFSQKQNDLLRELNNRNSDLRKLRRQAKNNSNLSNLISQIESKIQEIKNCTNSTITKTDSAGNCWDLFEGLNPLFEKAYLAEAASYLQRELKDLDRKERDFVRMEKDGIDTSGLRTKLTKIKNLIEQMMNATDSDTREDMRWEKEDIWEEFNKEMNNAFRSQEFAQFDEQCDKHVKREVERAKKELTRGDTVDVTVIAKLDGLVAVCQRIVAQAKAEADTEEFIDGWEIGERLRKQVWEKLEELTRSFHEDRMCKDVSRGAKELDRGLNVEASTILAKVPTSVKPKLEKLIKKGKVILNDIHAALSSDDCEKAARIMQDAEELHWHFKKIMRDVGLEKDLINYEEDYKDMYKDFVDTDFDVNEGKFKEFMKTKRFGINEMNQMKKLSKDVLAEYIENTVDSEDATLEFASRADLENSKLQALIQAKNELMAEVQTLRDQVHTFKQEIQNITAELGNYNFGIGAAKDEAKLFAGRLSTLSETEAREEFRKIKEKAITQKLEEGLIGFRDADDTAWFSGFALKAKNKGLIKGNADGTMMNPSGNLNYSEAVVAFGRITGIDEKVSSSSAIAQRLASWAGSSVAALESKGVNLDFMQHVNAGDAIKREEVAILLNDVLNLSDAAIADTSFTDLGTASVRAQQAIANVNVAGIMTGKGGTTEFGVGENLSRAALTKVLVIATE